MGNAVTWFDQMIAVPGVLPVLREFSYHRYGGVSLANLQAIAARAKQYHLDTAMLEWWSSSNGYATLHEDLKIGNNSAWQQGVLGGALNSDMSLYQIDTSNPAPATRPDRRRDEIPAAVLQVRSTRGRAHRGHVATGSLRPCGLHQHRRRLCRRGQVHFRRPVLDRRPARRDVRPQVHHRRRFRRGLAGPGDLRRPGRHRRHPASRRPDGLRQADAWRRPAAFRPREADRAGSDARSYRADLGRFHR